jgi:hypothetical protein
MSECKLHFQLRHPLEAVAQAHLLHHCTPHELIGHGDRFLSIHLLQLTPGGLKLELHRQTELRNHPVRKAHST